MRTPEVEIVRIGKRKYLIILWAEGPCPQWTRYGYERAYKKGQKELKKVKKLQEYKEEVTKIK